MVRKEIAELRRLAVQAQDVERAGAEAKLAKLEELLLQAAGQTNGLRALLKAERERGPDFLRLSNALSAL